MYFGDFGNDKAITIGKLREILENLPADNLIKANDDHLVIFSSMAPETGTGPIGKIELGLEEYKEFAPNDHA
jgi:hypothetical protein